MSHQLSCRAQRKTNELPYVYVCRDVVMSCAAQDTNQLPWWTSVGIGIFVYVMRFKVSTPSLSMGWLRLARSFKL